MSGKAYLNLTPKRKAAKLPVQAPVAGRGMATNNTKAKAPNLLNFGPCFLRVRAKSQLKKRSKSGTLRRSSAALSRYSKMNITGMMFPITARR